VTIWLDNQLPPALANWVRATLAVACVPVRDLKLQRSTDHEIFQAARQAQVVVMTKDGDFVNLLERHGAPPQVIIVTCGNTSNVRLRQLIEAAWPALLTMLERGEALVDLGDKK
jgi:predicted nuclease of predicted toxin-antitoxin system